MKVTQVFLTLVGSALLSNAQTIDLGSAGQFGALAPAGVTNTGLTVVNGDVGTTGTSITGFPPGVLTGSLVTGPDAAEAQADSESAYAQGQALPFTVDQAGLTTIGGLTFVPGVYNFDADVTLDGTLTLSGSGVFVFQLASTFTAISGSIVLLTKGATPCNVFWIVGTAATIGTNTVFAGNILASTAITFNTGATVSGGLYAGSAVTLDTNVIFACEDGPIPSASSSSSSAPLTSTSSLSSSSSVVVPSTTSSVPSSTTSTAGLTTTKKTSTTSTTKKTSTTSATKKTSTSASKKTSTSSIKKPTTTLKERT